MASINGTSGDDTLDGTSGNDSITGQSGNDSIGGDLGDDTIEGGSGNDTLEGGAGRDSVVGGEGQDLIKGDGQKDTLDGGEGDDTLFGGDDDDLVFGGEGNDSIDGEGQHDNIDGGAGDDHVSGSGGYDSIAGGLGQDTLDGGAQDDTIFGNSGDDVLIGDGGADFLHGGRGNDTLTGGGQADTFVLTNKGGNDVIEDFNQSDGDVVSVTYPGINSFTDLQPFIGSDGASGTRISLPDGTTYQLKDVAPGALSASDFVFNVAPICFLRGTRLLTEHGWVAIEKLRCGTKLRTQSGSVSPVLFITHQRFRFCPGDHRMKPIRIAAKTFGQGTPCRELLVSPQHRVALPQKDPKQLVPAKKLLGIPGVTPRPNCRIANYYNVLLPQHSLVQAEGMWVETLLNAPETRKSLQLTGSFGTASKRTILPINKSFAGSF